MHKPVLVFLLILLAGCWKISHEKSSTLSPDGKIRTEVIKVGFGSSGDRRGEDPFIQKRVIKKYDSANQLIYESDKEWQYRKMAHWPVYWKVRSKNADDSYEGLMLKGEKLFISHLNRNDSLDYGYYLNPGDAFTVNWLSDEDQR